MDDVTILKDVRGTDAEQKTLLIRGGHIAWIGSELPPGVRDVPVFSGGGGLLLPALVDAHEHVDMTLWGMPWRPSTARDGSIEAFVENERAYRLGLPPVADRMRGVIDALVASGTLLVRSHTQVDPEIGLGNVEALLGVREEFRDRVSLQIVAFPQFGILSEAGTADLMEEAVRMGAEVVGGIDPGESDDDSKGHLDVVFGIADRQGCMVDVHLHTRGKPGFQQIEAIIDRTSALGLGGRVAVSHAFCLPDADEATVRKTAVRLAEARVAITTSGWMPPLPLRLLRDEGVTVALGRDGGRDLWSPYGSPDMLERAMLVSWTEDFGYDEDLEYMLRTATTDAARVLMVEDYGLEVGCRADLVVLPAEVSAEAVAMHPPRSLVMKSGKVVGGTLA